jgi:hypothetical protein
MTTENADDRKSTDDEHPADTDWKKVTNSVTASIDAAAFGYEFGDHDPDVEDLRGEVEVRPSDDGIVNLEFEISCDLRGFPARFGALEHLTPEQADDLAVALEAAAEQARNGGADFDFHGAADADVDLPEFLE